MVTIGDFPERTCRKDLSGCGTKVLSEVTLLKVSFDVCWRREMTYSLAELCRGHRVCRLRAICAKPCVSNRADVKPCRR